MTFKSIKIKPNDIQILCVRPNRMGHFSILVAGHLQKSKQTKIATNKLQKIKSELRTQFRHCHFLCNFLVILNWQKRLEKWKGNPVQEDHRCL